MWIQGTNLVNIGQAISVGTLPSTRSPKDLKIVVHFSGGTDVLLGEYPSADAAKLMTSIARTLAATDVSELAKTGA